jgi:hypothetical protein
MITDMRIRSVVLMVLMAALLGAVPSFGGQIFFSNLVEPGDQYGPDGLGIGHTPSFLPGETGEVISATKFTSPVAFQLSSIEAPLGYVFGSFPNGPNQVDVFLMSDAAGLPGSIIESWHLLDLPSTTPIIPLTTIASSLNPVLAPGQQYWVAASGGPDTFDIWSLTLFQGASSGPDASRVIRNGVDSGWVGVSDARTGALVVTGDPVPEPTPLFLVLLGFVSFAAIWARKRGPGSLEC